MNNRSRRFNMLLSPLERQMLDVLVAAKGLSASDVLRQYIRTEFRALHPGLVKTTGGT